MTEPGAEAVAQVRDARGTVFGAGFLVAADLVVTCAHVVADAAGLDHYAAQAPPGPVHLAFPFGAGAFTAAVEGWTPLRRDGSGDIALLRLVTPAGVRPARLTAVPGQWHDEIRVFGFPPDRGDAEGDWVEAELRAGNPAGFLQVESAPGRRSIDHGFSGSPAFHVRTGRVIGMVVTAVTGARYFTAFLLPVRALTEAQPLLAMPDPEAQSPYRGLLPFLTEHETTFRGREALTDRLARATLTRRLLLLTGASGSGKSSLLWAGLVPRLLERGVRVVALRTEAGVPPLTALAHAVLPILRPEAHELDLLEPAEELAAKLAADPATRLPWLAGVLAREVDGGVLLVADQLEEAPAAHARELLTVLHDLTAAAPGLLAVATLRAADLDVVATEATAAAIEAGVVLVPPMDRAQLRAAVHAGEVDFEAGLDDRILDDAEREAGQLPLVQFTLEQLWEKQSTGMLTRQAYEELGGVSGAIAGEAERVYAGLTAAQQARARGVLVRMARPAGDGEFQRRPVRVDELGEPARDLLAELAAARLVIIGRAADGTEIAGLAHQALIGRWPRLAGWLAEDRDLRAWQEDVRTAVERWPADEGLLLRGGALATARDWVAGARGRDLSPGERELIAASERLELRRQRRLRSVIAGMTVLVLVAAGFALLAGVRSAEAQQRLRTAASRQLADDAMRYRTVDPGTAVQLAQAAWATGHTGEAYGALLTMYASLQGVERMFENGWAGEIERISASRDGSVAMITNSRGQAWLWQGLGGPGGARRIDYDWPGHRIPPGQVRVSPSGRLLAYANDQGQVLVWKVAEPAAPMVLSAGPAPGPDRWAASVAFSAAEDQVLVMWQDDSSRGLLGAWELAGGRELPVFGPIPGDAYPTSAAFGKAPGTIVVQGVKRTTAVLDRVTGRVLHSFPAGTGVIAEQGAVVAGCSGDQVHVYDTATGKARPPVPIGNCDTEFVVDGSGNYVLTRSFPLEEHTNAFVTALELATSKIYRLVLPRVDVAGTLTTTREAPAFTILTGPGGAPAALLGQQEVLHRVRFGPPVTLRSGDLPYVSGTSQVSSDDGRYAAELENKTGRLVLTDAATNRELARTTTKPRSTPITFRGRFVDFTDDGNRLLVVEEDELVVRTLPALTVERRLPLPVPADLGAPENGWASTVIAAAGEAVVLHAGVLTRWRLADGSRTSAEIPVSQGDLAERRTAAQGAWAGMMRPRHPDQVVVRHTDGSLAVWDLAAARTVATFDAEIGYLPSAMVFNRDGSRLAASDTNGVTTVWRVDNPGSQGVRLLTGLAADLIGFTRDDKLVTKDGADLVLWDVASGKRLAGLAMADDVRSGTLHGNTLTSYGTGLERVIELDPVRWMRELCDRHDRPYTDEERILVRTYGITTTPPCRDLVKGSS